MSTVLKVLLQIDQMLNCNAVFGAITCHSGLRSDKAGLQKKLAIIQISMNITNIKC